MLLVKKKKHNTPPPQICQNCCCVREGEGNRSRSLSQILVSNTGTASLKLGSRLCQSMATGPKCFPSSRYQSWDLLQPLRGNHGAELACLYLNCLYGSLHLIKSGFLCLWSGLDVAHDLSDEKANNSPHQSALHFLCSFIKLNSSCYQLFICCLLCVHIHIHPNSNVN